MAKQTINIGASPNDGTGTPLRTAFDYTNQNFTELYTAVGPSGNNIVVPGTATITGDLTVDTNVLKVDTTLNRVSINTTTFATDSAFAVKTTAGKFDVRAAGSLSVKLNSDQSMLYNVPTGNSHLFQINDSDAMTLNASGLGVGGSPANFPNYTTIHAIGKTTTAGGVFQTSTSNNSTAARFACSSTGVDLFVETNHPIDFYTNAIKRMTLDTSGNVGIGVTPSAWGGAGVKVIDVGAAGSFAGSAADVGVVGNAYYNGSGWIYKTSFFSGRYAYALGTGQHQWFTAATGTAGNSITFTQAMTLDASGNLLVGTTAPLQISNNPAVTSRISNLGTGSKGSVILRENEVSAFWGGNLFLQKVRGTSTAVQSGDILGTVAFGGFDGTNYVNTAVIQTSVTGAVSAGVVPVKIQVVATSGGVELTNTATSWAAISDERLKDIIEPINNAVSKVGLLRSVIGKYKSDSEGTRRSFLIAQDVQSALPEAVGGNEDSMTVRYTEVIPLLVAAIKELTAEVNALKKA